MRATGCWVEVVFMVEASLAGCTFFDVFSLGGYPVGGVGRDSAEPCGTAR